jgi:pimeloyl-ACP methyl ester carboxylesterase
VTTARRFVLVHGAWQTAGTWDLARPELERSGHEVRCPRLTGLEARGDLTAAVTLDTHVKDIVDVIESERLRDVTLVGHSYAGMIITGVAERIPDRLRRLVYVDAFVPSHDESVIELLPETIQRSFRDQARTEGNGWRLPAGERQLDLWGLKPGSARDFVRSNLSDFSINCFEQRIHLPNNRAAGLPRAFIACVAEGYPARAAFQPFAERARRERWCYHELPTGHDCHVEMPGDFAKLLESV